MRVVQDRQLDAEFIVLLSNELTVNYYSKFSAHSVGPFRMGRKPFITFSIEINHRWYFIRSIYIKLCWLYSEAHFCYFVVISAIQIDYKPVLQAYNIVGASKNKCLQKWEPEIS